MGTTSIHLLAATNNSRGGFNPIELILILVVVVGFYMLMIRPQRRRQQQVQQQQNSVRPGARVRTTAGMYATVVAVDDEAGDVVLEVAPGVETRYMKRAIMDVISNGEEPEEPEEPEASAEDEPADGEPQDTAEEGHSEESETAAKSAGGTKD